MFNNPLCNRNILITSVHVIRKTYVLVDVCRMSVCLSVSVFLFVNKISRTYLIIYNEVQHENMKQKVLSLRHGKSIENI